MESSWNHQEIIKKSSLNHHGAINQGAIMETSWGLHGIFMESSWNHQSWNHHGVFMEYSRNHHGIIMEPSIMEYFRKSFPSVCVQKKGCGSQSKCCFQGGILLPVAVAVTGEFGTGNLAFWHILREIHPFWCLNSPVMTGMVQAKSA